MAKRTNKASRKPAAKAKAKRVKKPAKGKPAGKEPEVALVTTEGEAIPDYFDFDPNPVPSKLRKKVGRPRLYDSPESMEQALNFYIHACESRTKIVITRYKDGREEIEHRPNPKAITMQGAAFALGFLDRHALDVYGKTYAEFSATITRMRVRIENQILERVQDNDTSPAASKGCQWAGAVNHGMVPKLPEPDVDPNAPRTGIIRMPIERQVKECDIIDIESKEM